MTEISELLYLLIFSFIISYTVRPVQIKLIWLGFNKRTASMFIISVIFIFLISCIIFLIPSVINESSHIGDALSNIQLLIDDIYRKLKPLSENKVILKAINNISEKVNSNSVAFMEGLLSSTLSLGSSLVYLAVIPIITYYFLVDGDILHNRFINLFPLNWRHIAKKTGCDIDKVLGKYISSQFFLSFIIGILTFIVLIIYKVQFPVILSLMNAFFNIIPYFGPIFGAIPCIMIALLKSPTTALWVALWIYLIQQLEGNILQPKITGDSVNMHPVAVIILLLIGGNIGGFLGMILAIPIGVIIKIIYEDINYYIF